MSNAKSRLDALKSAFDKKASSGGGGDQTWKLFFPFWKIEEGATAIFRFLPDLDENNNLGFLVEKKSHELVVNGQRKQVPCLQMWGERCPICDQAKKHYDEKNDDLGKKYYRKLSYIGQGIVIDAPIEHDQAQLVKLIEFGPQVFKQIQAAFSSGDLEEEPQALKGGYNFRFRKTKTGSGQNSYTTSNFAPKQTDLDDDVIEQLNLYNLADYRGTKPELATVQALLVADQTGQNFSESAGEEAPAPSQAQASAPKQSAAPAPVETSAPAPVAESTPAAEEGGKSNDIMAQLRARRAAQAAAAAESSDE